METGQDSSKVQYSGQGVDDQVAEDHCIHVGDQVFPGQPVQDRDGQIRGTDKPGEEDAALVESHSEWRGVLMRDQQERCTNDHEDDGLDREQERKVHRTRPSTMTESVRGPEDAVCWVATDALLG